MGHFVSTSMCYTAYLDEVFLFGYAVFNVGMCFVSIYAIDELCKEMN